jgi:RNA polymerase sigma-70 factor, ECF subfamily
MTNLEDVGLIGKVLVLGDKRSFDQLVLRHQSPVRRFLLHLTNGNETLTDDLAQETFIRAYLHLHNFRGISKFSTWLYRISYNLFYDYQRSSKEHLDEELEVAGVNIEVQPDNNKELSNDLELALSTLKAEERAVMLLFYMEDLSVDAISGVMQLPVNTVKSHLHRSRNKMKTFLTTHGYE